MKDWIKKALTKTIQPKGRGSPTIIEPDEKLVYGVKFTLAMTISLSALEIAHMLILRVWNSEIFAAITGLTGTISGIIISQKA